MTTWHKELQIETAGENDIVDLTSSISELINESGIKEGIVCVSCIGSTGSITTMEFEPGLKKDIPIALEKIAPRDMEYAHHQTWHDDNGRSHVRASILGPSCSLPIQDSSVVLGTWQQIVFIESDTRSRSRRISVMIVGD